MVCQKDTPENPQEARQESRKHFLLGLHPGPPADHLWREYGNYSIYTADQHRSVWEYHTHDCTQITVAMSPAQVRGEWQGPAGRLEHRELNGDMLWLVPPGVQHLIHFDRPASLIHLYLNEMFFRTMVEGAPENTQESLTPSVLVRDPFMVELGRSLHREASAGLVSELFAQSVATMTGTHLVRRYCGRRGHTPEFKGGLGPTREKKIRSYIAENLGDQLSLSDMAAVVQMSPNYFVALFRQSIGMTPHRYLVGQRVEQARRLLRQSGLSLLEVGQRCGFPAQSQFTTTFNRYLGTTPGQYRREMQSR